MTPTFPKQASFQHQGSTQPLSERIQSFYDESSGLWESVWGEHMHHGYYGPLGTDKCSSPQEAQRILIEKLLDWSDPTLSDRPLESILDVGCGIGGSTLYLASKFRTRASGITLSPLQARRAKDRATAAGLGSHLQFEVADALAMPFPDESFDLVWSLESGEHMPDKAQFLQECSRVLKPGGRLILATWCHRNCVAPQSSLTADEKKHLADLYRLYHLPYVISLDEYRAIAQTLPLSEIRTADWSKSVAPFWQDVVKSALNPAVLWGILTTGMQTVEGALAIPLMMEGYRTGLIRYGLLTGVKSATVKL